MWQAIRCVVLVIRGRLAGTAVSTSRLTDVEVTSNWQLRRAGAQWEVTAGAVVQWCLLAAAASTGTSILRPSLRIILTTTETTHRRILLLRRHEIRLTR